MSSLLVSSLEAAVFERLPESIAIYDRTGRVEYVNPTTERMFGRDRSQLLGKVIWEVFPEAVGNPFHRAFVRVAEHGDPEIFEHHYVPWNQWFDNHVFRLEERVVVVAREITAQKTAAAERESLLSRTLAAQDALRRREAWLEAVIEGSPIGLCVLDRELRFVRVNPALAKLNEVPAEAHLGRTLAEVLPASARVEPLYRQVIESGEPVASLTVPVRWREELRVAEVSIYPVVVHGRVEGVVGMVQDVSDRKRDEARRELLAKASVLFAAPLEVQETVRQIANLFVPSYAEWSTVYLRRDDGLGQMVAAAHREAESEPLLWSLFEGMSATSRRVSFHQRAMDSGQYMLAEVDDHDLERLASGDEAWLALARKLATTSVLVVPMVNVGRVIGTIMLGTSSHEQPFHVAQAGPVEDVANRAAIAIENARLFEMAQAERRRADEANRAKDEFLAVVSHELRTPLNAILGWSRMLLGDSLPPAQSRKALETIERNAKAQAQLVEDLLDYARIISGKLRLELESFDMAEIVEAATEVVTPAANAKGVRIMSMLDRSVGPMVGDPGRLQQAVWNLLTNAVKFTPRGGRVMVRLERVGSSSVVAVEDTGVGIDPEFVPHVFERFRQADMGSKRKHGGLGLGLAIVKHIVELHGGTVDAASEGVDHGATFRIALPITPLRHPEQPKAVRGSTTPATPLAPVAARLAGLVVLVVDDEPDARELLSSMLSSCGMQVRTAGSAREALHLLESTRFDVLVSDIGMPDEDGYDFIERVRGLSPDSGGRTPAVALTAYARTADRTRALLAGYNAHVTKPVDSGELIAVLASLSGRVRPGS